MDTKTAFSTGTASDDDGVHAGHVAASTAREKLSTDRVDFCQLFCLTHYDYEAVIDGVRSVIGPDAELIGCSATGAFTEERTDIGVVVSLVTSDTHRFFTGLGTGIEASVSSAVREAVTELPTEVSGYPYLSAINLHDGLRGNGEQLALITKRKLGPKVSVVGGTASDDLRLESTHVFRNDTVVEDAVVLALIASKERPIISLGHGHEPISEPFEVTRSDGAVVYELDGRPAYEVWREVVRDRALETFDVDIDDLEPHDPEMTRVMGSYGLGIDLGDGYKIRQVRIDSKDGELICPVEIPEGIMFRVMYGSRDGQIDAARTTVREAIQAAETEIAGAFVYDCSCRAILLGEEFSTAVDAMSEELDVPLAGFETYGEVCLQMGQVSGLHNTSTVVMLLPR